MAQKWEMLISGQVQGVGFRYTSAQIAKRFEIDGWVKNLSDGRVELQIQGAQSELERYLEALKNGIHGRISAIDKVVAQADLNLRGFEIRR